MCHIIAALHLHCTIFYKTKFAVFLSKPFFPTFIICRFQWLQSNEPCPRLTRADRKCCNTSADQFLFGQGISLLADPRLHLSAHSKEQFSAKYISPSHTSAVLSCPLSSRCPAPALVHCSWRHSQHGGQGDSVNISYQILILKAVQRLWRHLCRIWRTACLCGRVGVHLLSKMQRTPPLFYSCIFT